MAIVLHPPAGTKPDSVVKLHSGAVARPDREPPYCARVQTEEDAIDLERKGWRRDAESAKAANFNSMMLTKGLASQGARIVGGTQSRTVVGPVVIPDVGSVHVECDQSADVVVLHGVAASLADIDKDLRIALSRSIASYAAAETSQSQVEQRALVGVVVDAILRRHDEFIGAKVKERLRAQRYD